MVDLEIEEVDGPQTDLGVERIVPVACGCIVVFYGPKEMLIDAVQWHEQYCNRPKTKPC